MRRAKSLAALPGVARRRALEALHRAGLLDAAGYVMEFPKSGGSWVRLLVLDVETRAAEAAGRRPRPVMHDHWRHGPRLRPAVYVVRDGRDVVVSLYFHHVRFIRNGSAWAGQLDAYFRRVLGAGYDLDDVPANLPAFIGSLSAHPFGGILRRSGNRRFRPWPAHVAEWHGRPGVLSVRYEDLLADAGRELARMAGHLGLPVDAAAIEAIVARHSFERKTGRPPGTEDRRAFLRKGIAGDWRNHFTRAAGEAFRAYGGETLISLGYAADDAWIAALPEARPRPGGP